MRRINWVLIGLSLVTINFNKAMANSARNFDLGFYGFIKASAIYATEALGSYNNINLSAPTHATAQTRSQDEISRLSFQAQQSRIGMTLKKDALSGKFEFDFIDFNKSSPTTQMNPRVRIASITYQKDSQNKFIFGQDWDLYSPVTSFTFDIVGLYFLAGNTGFTRQQFQFIHENDSFEVGGAIGMAGNNSNPSDGDLEEGKSPTFSFRVSKKLESGRIGLSAIYSSIEYVTADSSRYDSYAGNAFFEKLGSTLQIKSEAYYGQNVANIGLLGIGKGTASKDVREYGGTLTSTYKLNEMYSLIGGVGGAFIDNKTAITPFSLNTNGSVENTGIDKNFLIRLAFEAKITPDLSWITEASRFHTVSKISDNKFQTNVVPSLESGMILQF